MAIEKRPNPVLLRAFWLAIGLGLGVLIPLSAEEDKVYRAMALILLTIAISMFLLAVFAQEAD